MFDCRRSFFVQPHFDDVPLSCGGTAALLALGGVASHVLTVFGSDIVPKMVGEFAQCKHERWNLTDIDKVIETRRQEDTCAVEALGCSYRWLGLPDAIYRVDRYKSDEDLYGAIGEDELGLAAHLAREIPGLPEWTPDTRLFVPLSIGAHSDHQIAFEAGLLLARQGTEVWAYEDLPYAIHSPQAVHIRLDQVRAHLGEVVDQPIHSTLNTKLDAIGCYRTQLPVIFRFTSDWRDAVTRHAFSRVMGPRNASGESRASDYFGTLSARSHRKWKPGRIAAVACPSSFRMDWLCGGCTKCSCSLCEALTVRTNSAPAADRSRTPEWRASE